jgi:cyanophycinase
VRTAFVLAALIVTQLSAQEPKVGPPKGTIMAVGGSVAPAILARFIQEAGGPDALILDVPTAGIDSESTLNGGFGPAGQLQRVTDNSAEIIARWKAAGAKNVQVLHTRDRKVADSDSFVEPIKKAGGVWFGGGMPEQIIDAYAGTKAEREFRNVLERNGVLGGTSAGAVALGNLFTNSLQGDLSNLTTGEGFGILRGVALSPHAGVPNPAYLANHPELIRLAMPEVTAFVVRGDIAEIVGGANAFVYREDPGNPGRGFITLRPGDQYNLATHEIRRAIDASPLTEQFVDSLFSEFSVPGAPAATVLVALNDNILLAKSYNIPERPGGASTTTSPTFTLGDVADAFNAIAVQLLTQEGKLALDAIGRERGDLARLIDQLTSPKRMGARTAHEAFFRDRVLGGVGSFIAPDRVVGDHTTGEFVGSVDALHIWEERLSYPHVFGAPKPVDTAFGWQQDRYRALTRLSLFGAKGGKRHAFVRIPEKKISVVILTNKNDLNAQVIAEQITDRLLR